MRASTTERGRGTKTCSKEDMIVEGLFVYLPTIVAITVAFIVGVGVGITLCLVVGALLLGLIGTVPTVKGILVDYLNKES